MKKYKTSVIITCIIMVIVLMTGWVFDMKYIGDTVLGRIISCCIGLILGNCIFVLCEDATRRIKEHKQNKKDLL